MHILIIPSWYINNFNPLSGIFFKEQAEALVKQNHKIGLLTIHRNRINLILKEKKDFFFNKIYKEKGVYTHRVEYPSTRIYILNKYIKLKIFQRIFLTYIDKNGMPDIVHLHSFMDGELAMWVKKNYNIPYIVTEHFSGFARGTISKSNLHYAKRVFENASYNIAVSKEFQGLLESKYSVKFHYLPNIVNVDFFQNTSMTNEQEKEFTFINIASLNKNKNQEMLIRSFNSAFNANENIKLIIAGDGPEYTNLKKCIKELNLTKQVTLYGSASRKEVRTLLQKSNAFVLSSNYETFGIVIIEAMACGLPVVATKCGGPESIVTDNKLGVLCEINEKSMSKALKTVYENKDIYNAQYIRNYTVDNFSETAIVEKLNVIYKKVLKVT